MTREITHVITLDPGSTTGIAYRELDTGLTSWHQATPEETLAWLEERLESLDDARTCLVVCERFDITMRTVESSRGGSRDALDIIGAAKHLCRVSGAAFEIQPASEAKNFCTSDRLKRLGMYPKADHARDAVRHLVLALVKLQLVPASALV